LVLLVKKDLDGIVPKRKRFPNSPGGRGGGKAGRVMLRERKKKHPATHIRKKENPCYHPSRKKRGAQYAEGKKRESTTFI